MIESAGGRLRLTVGITLDNVTQVLAQGLPHLDGADVVFDLEQVIDVDSSAVSLLLEWTREAARRRRSVRFANLPENLKSLAKLYGVLELIPQA